MNFIGIVLIILGLWNTIVFAMYGIDKRKSLRNRQRISERTLLLTCALFGSVGALLGMCAFRHKTKHLKFKICVPVLLIIHLAIAAFLFRWYLAL